MRPTLGMAIRQARWCPEAPPVVELPVTVETLPAAKSEAPRLWFEFASFLDWRTPLVIAVDASLDERVTAILELLIGRNVTIPTIQRQTARVFEVSVEDMISHSKEHRYLIPRGVCIALCRRLTDKSTPEIGRRFGARDSSTVWHAIGQWRQLIEPALAEFRRKRL